MCVGESKSRRVGAAEPEENFRLGDGGLLFSVHMI